MTDLPIVTRLEDRVSGPECAGTADRDLLVQAAALIRQMHGALAEVEFKLAGAIPPYVREMVNAALAAAEGRE